MNPALGPFAIAATLLVLGGVLEARHPDDTARALRGLGLPGGVQLVRVGGAAEAVLGIVAVVALDTTIALLVAASYLAFAVVVGVARRRSLPIASCGCFGRLDTPPTLLHVGVNLGGCIAAVGMAVDTATTPLGVVTGHFPESIVYLVLVAAGVLAAFAALTWLPRALGSPSTPAA